MLQPLKVLGGLVALFFIDVLVSISLISMSEGHGSLDPSVSYAPFIAFMVCAWLLAVYLLSRFVRIEPAQLHDRCVHLPALHGAVCLGFGQTGAALAFFE